MGGKNLKSVNH